MTPAIVLRSILFALVQIISTPPFAILALLTFPMPALARYRIITVWSKLNVAAAKYICGIRYRVIGLEHLPQQPCVILAKHQSAWETMAFQQIFPPQVWVLKRELLWIPFFGWGLAMLSPIAIDRNAGARAIKRMLEQGRDRLAHGFWITVFPEGTRIAPGARGRYRSGGAAIAIAAGVPVLPVVHNAGYCWPRGAFLKRPGTITVSIAPALDTKNADAAVLTQRVADWIETESARIGKP